MLLNNLRKLKLCLKPARQAIVMMSSNASTSGLGGKVEVNGSMLYYEKVGTGSHPVLLLPGALGTAQSDFKPQLEHLNKDKLTLVAWDPPGYGKSRPPDRDFNINFLHDDATVAKQLMNKLGFDKFSLLGWSDGGITSFIMAAMFPDSVKKLIAFGGNAYISSDDLKLYESVRDITKWSERMRAPMVEIYGLEYFKKAWEQWCDTTLEIFNKRNGNLCKDDLGNIKCPTLIIHGQKDAMVGDEHPKFLIENIKDSKLKVYPDGKHNLHLKYWQEFNQDVEQFLLHQS